MGKWCLHASLFLGNKDMFFEMRFDLGTLDLGERSLPFGLFVSFVIVDGDVKPQIKQTNKQWSRVMTKPVVLCTWADRFVSYLLQPPKADFLVTMLNLNKG